MKESKGKDDLVSLILSTVDKEARHESAKQNNIGLYRASAIGGCPRALQYATLNYKAESVTPESQLIFKDGHLHHHGVREILSRCGSVTNVEMSIQKRYKHKGQRFIVTGTVDLVWNGRMVIDIKSMNGFSFDYLDRDFAEGKYDHYIDQLILYMDMLGLDKGCLLFKDKNFGQLRAKYIDFNKFRLNAILDRLAEMHRLVKKKKFIARPYTHKSKHCSRCPFRIHCWRMPMDKYKWPKQKGMPKSAEGVGKRFAPQGVKNATESTIEGQLRESIRRARKPV